MKKGFKCVVAIASIVGLVSGGAMLLKKFKNNEDEDFYDDLEDFDDSYDDTYDNMYMDKREYVTLNNDNVCEDAPQEKEEDRIQEYEEDENPNFTTAENLVNEGAMSVEEITAEENSAIEDSSMEVSKPAYENCPVQEQSDL